LLKVRARNLQAFVEQARPYFEETIAYEPAAVEKHWSEPAETRVRLMALRDRYSAVDEWDAARLETVLRELADELGIGAGKLIHPLRVALVGTAVSPGIFDVLAVMGRERTLRRLDAAIRSEERRGGKGSRLRVVANRWKKRETERCA